MNLLLPNSLSFSNIVLIKAHLFTYLQRLYRLGARKVVMFDIGPIGCIPNNTNTQPVKGQCSQEINNFVLEFNNRFTPLVQHLNSTLRGSHFIPGLTYPITENMYRDAARLGKILILLTKR